MNWGQTVAAILRDYPGTRLDPGTPCPRSEPHSRHCWGPMGEARHCYGVPSDA